MTKTVTAKPAAGTTPAPTLPADLPAPYKPTPAEQGALEAVLKAQRQLPRMKIQTKGGIAHTTIDHPDPAIAQAVMMQSLGTTSIDFFSGLVGQLGNAGSTGKEMNEDRLNFMLSMVQGIEPRDQVEAMLAAQMAATHNAMMTFARRLNHVDNIQQQDSAERAFNKLGRTFAAQVEALKRYRSSGDQTMRVEHVTVTEGGQAIVGNVSGMGRGGAGKAETTP